jgi:HTH-like domain
VRIFAFVDAQKADFPVRTLCRVCKVSASGFYAWAARIAAGPGPAAAARQVTAAHVARVHAASRCRYGSPRVTAQLAWEGITVNHKAVEREMARHVVLDPAIGNGEREDRAQCGQSARRGRWGQAAGNQAAHLRPCDRGNRPIAETRPHVGTPIRLIALAGPALDRAARTQQRRLRFRQTRNQRW